MRLVWLPEARDDVQRLYDFLLEEAPLAAARAMRVIRQGGELLLEHPSAGRPMDDETARRELFIPFGVSAYVLRYRIHEETIVVLRVWHSREVRL